MARTVPVVYQTPAHFDNIAFYHGLTRKHGFHGSSAHRWLDSSDDSWELAGCLLLKQCGGGRHISQKTTAVITNSIGAAVGNRFFTQGQAQWPTRIIKKTCGQFPNGLLFPGLQEKYRVVQGLPGPQEAPKLLSQRSGFQCKRPRRFHVEKWPWFVQQFS